MKKILLLLALSINGLCAQQQPDPTEKYDVATKWPNVHFQVFHIERIPGDRLLIGVKVYTTPNAPLTGTFIGVDVPMPKDASPVSIAAGMYRPNPFSIDSAVMTEEMTKQDYATVKPDPNGPNYVPSQVLATLHPNEGRMMSIEFPAPPLPPPGAPPKQTVSILFPNAVGPIRRIELPPPAAPKPTP
jgi:hypothetical protein